MDPGPPIRYLNIRPGILLTDLLYGMSKVINVTVLARDETAKRNLFCHVFSHLDSYRAKFLSKIYFDPIQKINYGTFRSLHFS
jgi:hypothetical protein